MKTIIRWFYVSLTIFWAAVSMAETVQLPVVFMPQYPPGNAALTRNCGPACLAMAAAFAKNATNGPKPEEISAIDRDLKFSDDQNGQDTVCSQIIKAATDCYQLDVHEEHWTTGIVDKIKAEIRQGGPVICAVEAKFLLDRTYGWAGGHYILAVGFTDTEIICNDPGTKYGTTGKGPSFYSFDEFINASSAKDQGNAVIVGFRQQLAKPMINSNNRAGKPMQPKPSVIDNFLNKLPKVKLPDFLNPGPSVAKAQMNDAKLIQRFWFDYDGQPEPGRRYWLSGENGLWVERYPSGKTTTYHAQKHGKLNNMMGTLVQRDDVSDEIYQIFVPDENTNPKILAFRHGVKGEWQELAKINYDSIPSENNIVNTKNAKTIYQTDFTNNVRQYPPLEFRQDYPGTFSQKVSETHSLLCSIPNQIESLTISENENKIAYIAQLGNQYRVIVNGTNGKVYAIIKSLTISKDGSRVVYQAFKAGQWCVVDNGIEGNYYDDLREIVFSPDGKHLAYQARKGDQWCVVVDGIEGKLYDNFIQFNIEKDIKFIFSPNSNHYAYIIAKDNKECVVFDGIEGNYYYKIFAHSMYGDRHLITFSSDGDHYCYIACKEDPENNREIGDCCVVIDGINGNWYKQILSIPTFSINGKHYAYEASIENQGFDPQQFVVSDGIKGKIYKWIETETLIINNEGQVAYMAIAEDLKKCVVIGNEEGAHYQNIIQQMSGKSTIKFSNDGNNYAYIAQKNEGKFTVIINGQEVNSYNVIHDQSWYTQGDIISPIFSPDSTRCAFVICTIDDKYRVVVDGHESHLYDDISSFTFSPDSKHFAFVGKIDGKQCMVIDGRQEKLYDYINYCYYSVGTAHVSSGDPHFSSDSQHLAYSASINDKMCMIIDGQEHNYHNCVGTPTFISDNKHVTYFISDNNQNTLVVDDTICTPQFSGFIGTNINASRSLSRIDDTCPLIMNDNKITFIGIKGDKIMYYVETKL